MVMKDELKDKKKAIAETRESLWTGARIEYNNKWPSNGIWYSDVQELLDNYLKEKGYSQVFKVVELKASAKRILFEHPKLNKLVSGIIDIYDELPYRPDEAFDIAWRSLEIFMNHHKNIAWKQDENIKTPHLLERSVKDLVIPLINREQRVKKMWDSFLNDIPIPALKYAIIRCYITHDLAINSQLEHVSSRAEEQLSKALYEDIKTKYMFQESIKPNAAILRRSSLLLQKLLKGDTILLGGHRYQLPMENRLLFVLNCIIYTNRCERFHGDYFSPFKSDLATLETYAFSYYILSFTYIILWTLLFRHCELNSIEEICSLDSILDAGTEILNRLRPLLRK